MKLSRLSSVVLILSGLVATLAAAPAIDPIPNANIPAGKSLTIPVTASSPNGRPLAYTITSSTNRISVEVQTNNPFWKLSVVQLAPGNAPGAFQTPFRGGVVTVTNIGDLTLMLFRDRAPHTVDVFQGLTSSGFYSSNTIFHRVVPNFVIQGGDPATNGLGGPIFRYDDEFHPRAIFSGNGQLAMANSGKDTDGSQFFITQGPQRFLDFGYTIFGQVVRGFSVITNVITTPRNANDRPLADVIITRASFVPDTTDMVLTLTGTNLPGVSGTIQVVADDGLANGRVTNSFTATTVSDAANNSQTFLKTPAITNQLLTAGIRVTNYVQALDLEGNPIYYQAQFGDITTQNNVTSGAMNLDGGLAFTIVPGYAGHLTFYLSASQDSAFIPPYDQQVVTFAVGDTAISAVATNFTTQPLVTLSNQVLATFTNGIFNSPTGNFTAAINWGDNTTNSASITTNGPGLKEVRGTHSYTNSGDYPIYITIKSSLGATATVVATAMVRPSLTLTRNAANDILKWPAWASAYQLQSHTNFNTADWMTLTNLSALVGYENVVTNVSSASDQFFRLKR